MKKEFQIKIYKSSVILSSLTDLISQHNQSDRQNLSIEDIHGYVKCQSYRFYMNNLISELIMDELVVMENGEDVSFVIQEKIMVELEKENEEKGVAAI